MTRSELLDFLKIWGIVVGGVIVAIAVIWGCIALLAVAPILGVVLFLLAVTGVIAWAYTFT